MEFLGESSMIIKQKVHDFNDSLSVSNSASDLPIWKTCYEKFFPDMVSMVDHREMGHWQHDGIDRSIILKNSKQILIDEKFRPKSYPQYDKEKEKFYYDIALEFISNDTKNTPGWVSKSLKCDYVAYAIGDIRKCYLLPIIQLQLAWRKNSEEWKNKYFIAIARNNSYKTHSCCVPVDILFKDIGSFLRCDF